MRHVWDILKEINEKSMTYSEVVNKLQLNNAVVYRLLLVLKNSGLVTKQVNTYYISDLGQRMVELYVELDTPKRISFDSDNIAELVI